MSPARALALGGAVLLAAGVGLVAWALVAGGRDPVVPPAVTLAPPEPAAAPFAALTETEVEVGDRRLRVVVADEEGERIEGLRSLRDAAPYDGMLFVFPADTTTGFTMAGVPGPLDLAFFDAAGRRLGDRAMAPCAASDAACPGYFAPAPYRFALETAAGAMPAGDLRAVDR